MSNSQVCQTGCDHQPQVCIDWCDAYAYCEAVGKRLCGELGGGAVDFTSGYIDPAHSEWHRACTSAGANTYPYGSTYAGTACNTTDYAAGTTINVGTLAGCQSTVAGYGGVYDLSGNVMEWENSCDGVGASAGCHLRGGNFSANIYMVTCAQNNYSVRSNAQPSFGFRCCAQ